MTLARDDPRHGTLTGYAKHRCRCDACREASAEWQRQRQKRVLAPDDPRHGTIGGYTNYRCRCDRCKEAKRNTRLAYEAQHVRPTRARATTRKPTAARVATPKPKPKQATTAKRPPALRLPAPPTPMPGDPPVRADGLCVVCLKARHPERSVKYARGHADIDPFCSTTCCRAWHGTSAPERSIWEQDYGIAEAMR